jgi:CBS domain-containing protein
MKIIEIMNRSVITCHPNEALSAIINKFKMFNISGMPVAEKKHLTGMITFRDVSSFLPAPEEMCKEKKSTLEKKFATHVKEIMTTPALSLAPTTTVDQAARVMVEHHINRVPVVDRDRIVGIVTRWDIIKALAETGN